MAIEILCRPNFTADELAAIDKAAKTLGKTREEFVRQAVSVFAAKCVPTHSRKASGKAKV